MPVTATIVELDAAGKKEAGTRMQIDFNPQTLRLSHSASGPISSQTLTGADSKSGSTDQRTGTSSTLSMELLFDSTRDGTDVRQKTLVLVALTRPATGDKGGARMARFSWGSFLFVGSVDQVSETIDLFSADGVPLRATVSLAMRDAAPRDVRPESAGGFGAGAGAGIGFGASAGFSAGASVGANAGFSAGASAGFSAGASASTGAGISAGAAIGTVPLATVSAGDSIQAMATKAGVSWKAVAAANGIDNPRIVPAGTVIDLRVS